MPVYKRKGRLRITKSGKLRYSPPSYRIGNKKSGVNVSKSGISFSSKVGPFNVNSKRGCSTPGCLLPIIIIIAILFTGCTNTFCPDSETYEAGVLLDDLFERWDDANRIANSTARINLAPQVSELQAIKRELDAIVVPECMTKLKNNASLGMDAVIEAYLLFMANESEELIDAQYEIYYSTIDVISEQFALIDACRPNCKPEDLE